MKIHEYQAKQIFKDFNVPVPNGMPAFTVEEADKAARVINGRVVVKAQIHAGGRGKGGGVKLAENAEKAKKHAQDILGMTLITHQTGPEGRLVKRLLIEEALGIKRELYLAILLDRETSRPVIIASEAGGMDIEKVASETPEKIIKESIDPRVQVQAFQGRKIAFALNLDKKIIAEMVKLIIRLYQVFISKDCSLVEINPLVITDDNRIIAADAKLNFDDSALYRHMDIMKMRDLDEEEALEIEASKHSLSYIKLDGEVGCMVNGAGLAMATMDIIKLAGAEPANFLD
ncbi:MAG: ADP-forming succinate--CoA ligase subunit beta, partial [bacterium]